MNDNTNYDSYRFENELFNFFINPSLALLFPKGALWAMFLTPSTSSTTPNSFSASRDVQDYDLQAIIYSASLTASQPFYNKIGSSSVTIHDVYYRTPRASWRFFGGNAVGTVGNLSTYGQYADDAYFQLVPNWQNTLQAYAYEQDMKVRASHYSYEINNNKLRIIGLNFSFTSIF